MFTKRHYIAVAKILSGVEDSSTLKEKLFTAFINLFREDNPKFDSVKFFNVCYNMEPGKEESK